MLELKGNISHWFEQLLSELTLLDMTKTICMVR